MTWLSRLKKSAVASEPEPKKPTKPGFGGFGGTPAGLSQKSGGGATAANDPSQAQDFDREAFEERAAIMEFDGGLSRTESERLALFTDGANLKEPEADDPDRHSWPHTTAMNTTEIDALNARAHLFTRHGLDQHQAEGLADDLVLRDRDSDDRRLCLECLHLRGGGGSWACNQWRAAGLAGAGVPDDWVTPPKRCDGFKGAAVTMQQDHKPT